MLLLGRGWHFATQLLHLHEIINNKMRTDTKFERLLTTKPELALKKYLNFPTFDCSTGYHSSWFTLKSWYSNPSEH